MRWRALRLIGLALSAALATAPFARAQDSPLGPPVSFGVPTIPVNDAPAEPLAMTDAPKSNVQISPNTGMPRLEQPKNARNNIGIAQLAFESSAYTDPRYAANSHYPDDMGTWERLCVSGHEQGHRMVQDFKSFYLSENLLYVGVAIAIAAPVANTHADQGVRDWYQRGAGQSSGANQAADSFKYFGYYQYSVPVYLAFSFSEHFFPDSAAFAVAGEFSNRSLRALAVGAPTVGVLQVGLGAGRPYTGSSHWRPFNENRSVSGHAFVGAVPFLTAASMIENRPLKALLIAASFGPAWSRIQHDDHYLSQVILGWAIAYLSVESVNLTESQSRHMRIVPVDIPNGVGLGLQIEY